MGESIFLTFVLSSIKSDCPISKNAQGEQSLKEIIYDLANPEPNPNIPLPEIVNEISGKTYELDENEAQFEQFTLTFNDETTSIDITYWGERYAPPTKAFQVSNVSKYSHRS